MVSPGRRIVGPLPRHSSHALVSQRVRDAPWRRAPLTVLRAPRGFGKTTTIVQWLGEHDVPETVGYLSLDESHRATDEFWRALLDRLIAIAPHHDAERSDGAERSDAREACLRLLHGRETPLLLVLDNFHEAGPEVGGTQHLDDDLVEVLHANPGISLIVATRALRRLETTGALVVDTCVLGPADLALDATAVQELAGRRGQELSEEAAARLVVELGGWPAAIKGCVAATAGEDTAGRIDAALVDGYVSAMLDDIRSGELREHLLRSAVPEDLSGAELGTIPGPPGAVGLLRTVGLLQQRRATAGVRFFYPPAIRESLLRWVHEHRPELVREVHLALLPLAVDEGDPVAVLRHVVAIREWGTALSVLREEWSTLVVHHRRTLARLVAELPAELVATETRLQVLRDELSHEAGSRDEPAHRWAVAQPAYCRTALRLRAARAGPGANGDRATILFETATAAMLTAANERAARTFTEVREIGFAAGDPATSLIGTAGLLVTAAIDGDVHEAERWAGDALLLGVMTQPQDPLEAHAATSVQTGIALARIDAMTSDAAAAVAAIAEPEHRDEMWALGVAARGRHVATSADRGAAASSAYGLRNAMHHLAHDGLVAAGLGATLAELLVLQGRLDVAAQVLDSLPRTVVTGAGWAVLHLARGDARTALSGAEEMLAATVLTHRARLTALLVATCALHQLEQPAAAAQMLGEALLVARTAGQRRPFHLVPGEQLRAVATEEVLAEVRPDLAAPGVRSRGTAHRTVAEP